MFPAVLIKTYFQWKKKKKKDQNQYQTRKLLNGSIKETEMRAIFRYDPRTPRIFMLFFFLRYEKYFKHAIHAIAVRQIKFQK